MKKGLKNNCNRVSILDMGMIPINGKKSQQIAKEYGVSGALVRQFALKHDLPYISFDDGKTVEFYLFDKAAEQQFANRNTKPTGRPAIERPPKVPGKPGRPRKEKPLNTGPKNPVGRPRKYPKEGTDIVPKRQKGRPRKK